MELQIKINQNEFIKRLQIPDGIQQISQDLLYKVSPLLYGFKEGDKRKAALIFREFMMDCGLDEKTILMLKSDQHIFEILKHLFWLKDQIFVHPPLAYYRIGENVLKLGGRKFSTFNIWQYQILNKKIGRSAQPAQIYAALLDYPAGFNYDDYLSQVEICQQLPDHIGYLFLQYYKGCSQAIIKTPAYQKIFEGRDGHIDPDKPLTDGWFDVMNQMCNGDITKLDQVKQIGLHTFLKQVVIRMKTNVTN